jgi:hypothetical protein
MKNLREFEEKKLFPTMEHVQQAYIELCKDFAATPVTLTKFIRKGIFHFKNQSLPINQMKALLCIIPIIPNINHVKFENNHIQDEFTSLALFSIFMNPEVKHISMVKNFNRGSFAYTLFELMKRFPKRLKTLNFTNSFAVTDHLDIITYQRVKGNEGLLA